MKKKRGTQHQGTKDQSPGSASDARRVALLRSRCTVVESMAISPRGGNMKEGGEGRRCETSVFAATGDHQARKPLSLCR